MNYNGYIMSQPRFSFEIVYSNEFGNYMLK